MQQRKKTDKEKPQEGVILPTEGDNKEAMLHYLEFESYGNVAIACHNLGMHRSTYYRWTWDDEEYAERAKEAIKRGKQMLIELAESSLVTRVAKGDTIAIIFTLKSLDKKNYGEHQEEFNQTKKQILDNPTALTALLKLGDRIKEKLQKQEGDYGLQTPRKR